MLYLLLSHPTRGALRIVRNVGEDAVDAGSVTDEAQGCGRRSRVGLPPRCRWQVREELTLLADDGDNPAESHQGEHV